MYILLTHFNPLFYIYHRLRSLTWVKPAARVGLVGLLLCVVVVLVQLAYPSNRALPFASVQGKRVGLQSTAQLQSQLGTLDNRVVTIKAEKKEYQTSFEAIGVTVNAQAMAKTAVDYPVKLRFIPFSVLFHRPYVGKLDLLVNEIELNNFTSKVMEENFAAPVNAQVSIENTEVKVTPAVTGRVYDRESLLRQISETGMELSTELSLRPQQTAPAITTERATEAAGQARQRMSTPVTLKAAGTKITLDKVELANAIRFTAHETSISVDYDRTVIAAALQRLASSIYISPRTEVISFYDGAQVGHQPGAAGRTVAIEPNIDTVIKHLQQSGSDLELPEAAVGFGRQVHRDYSRSTLGLQVLINDWIQANGANFSVVLRSVDGSIGTGYNGDRQFVSASLYKLFVGYSIGVRLENGSLQPGDPTSTGQSVNDCLEAMIVISSNACGHALGTMVGWGVANGELNVKGFSGTSFDPLVTRSSDVALLLQQLYTHNLVSAGFDETLLDKLGRQIYRKGIPTGIPGVHIKNKVGYVDGYVHDSAIVYNPRGHYVLVVMSAYGNYSKIADLAGKINAIMSK